jgi:hypothetical protein
MPENVDIADLMDELEAERMDDDGCPNHPHLHGESEDADDLIE